MIYSEKVMDHFANPRNVGEIENADGIGEVGNAKCGDIMKMYLKIDNGIITDAKFKTFGCGAAVATSSMATELIKGKPIEDAERKLHHRAAGGYLRHHGRISAAHSGQRSAFGDTRRVHGEHICVSERF